MKSTVMPWLAAVTVRLTPKALRLSDLRDAGKSWEEAEAIVDREFTADGMHLRKGAALNSNFFLKGKEAMKAATLTICLLCLFLAGCSGARIQRIRSSGIHFVPGAGPALQPHPTVPAARRAGHR